jgi:hypothetical protein
MTWFSQKRLNTRIIGRTRVNTRTISAADDDRRARATSDIARRRARSDAATTPRSTPVRDVGRGARDAGEE